MRLRTVIQQVQQFEQRGAQLQQRVTLIEQLRKGQTGPVHLLDEVSRALPDTMWLLELRQSDTEVIIEGRCTNLNALSDFVSGLEVSNLFDATGRNHRQPDAARSGRSARVDSFFGEGPASAGELMPALPDPNWNWGPPKGGRDQTWI